MSRLSEFRDESVAVGQLAWHLTRGELVLLVGAGLSYDVGLPDWVTLVSRCEAKLGLDGASVGLSMMRRIATVQARLPASEDFRAFVRRHLYGNDWIERGAYPRSALSTDLLSAVGAMLGPSARGGVADVMSLNFDDALECYLRAEGHPTQTVADPGDLLRGNVDVRIHHFHGYLPLVNELERSSSIVFSQQDLVSRLGDQGSYWATFLRAQVLTKMLLIVGTSLDDIDVEVFLGQAGSTLRGSRHLGFVLDRQIPEDRARMLEDAGLSDERWAGVGLTRRAGAWRGSRRHDRHDRAREARRG